MPCPARTASDAAPQLTRSWTMQRWRMTGEKTSEHPMEGPVWGVMISLNLKGKESLASLLHDRRNVVPHCEIILERDGKNHKGGDTLHTGEGRENGATPAAVARWGANSSWVLETCPGEKVLNLEGNGRVILRLVDGYQSIRSSAGLSKVKLVRQEVIQEGGRPAAERVG